MKNCPVNCFTSQELDGTLKFGPTLILPSEKGNSPFQEIAYKLSFLSANISLHTKVPRFCNLSEKYYFLLRI
jgi:hypothetical protein